MSSNKPLMSSPSMSLSNFNALKSLRSSSKGKGVCSVGPVSSDALMRGFEGVLLLLLLILLLVAVDGMLPVAATAAHNKLTRASGRARDCAGFRPMRGLGDAIDGGRRWEGQMG